MTKVITNGHTRDFRSFQCFNKATREKIRREFDWIEDLQADGNFFEYRGQIYHIDDFTRINAAPHEALHGWHGLNAQTWSSGVVIKCDGEGGVIVGRYF